MELNSDFTQRAVVHGAMLPWQASPMPGVERRMLDRVGDEVARATSIVRYDPGSRFSPHVHGGGEEFLVLEGVFQDEHGDYPVGTYVRNPPTSSHRPGSAAGCVILVKLWQFDLADRASLTLDTTQQVYVADPVRPGINVMLLFADSRERVCLERWDANAEVDLSVAQGLEIFVLQGGFIESGEGFERYSWLRLPSGAQLSAKAGPAGCEIWLKQLC
jgi:ChrR Cupin-like domain